MKVLSTALLIAGLSSAAWADDVLLTNGRTLTGIAREEGGRVVVETRLGDIGVPRSEVQSIKPGRTPIHEYQERAERLNGCSNASEAFDLAMWAQDQGLVRYVNPLLQRTLEADPNHAEARKLLGFVQWKGHWIRSSERDAIMAVQEQHRAATARKPATVPVRRTTPNVERTPYQLGIPPSAPPRGSQRYDGGYGLWWWPVARGYSAAVPVPMVR